MSQETAGRSLTARLYAARAPRYDRYQWAFRQHRRRAVEHLDLVTGQTVVDVACGTGLNFGAIEGRIGPEGSLVGVDLNAEMLERAEARIEESGWSNSPSSSPQWRTRICRLRMRSCFRSLTTFSNHDPLWKTSLGRCARRIEWPRLEANMLLGGECR